MTLSKIAACSDIRTLKEALSHADFMVWNSTAEGSPRGAKVWQTRVDAIKKRIHSIKVNNS